MAYKHSRAKIEGNARYQKKAYIQYNVRLNKVNESDIIQHLETITNKRQYLIDLIRKDMEEK